ncbi:WecB/TagA/CpsF family glycosyltransferase [Patescibacteria group bacterium]|nr:WecB/TagA/CpsF family glycosyltransferase [Patescibacteria group bacterium]
MDNEILGIKINRMTTKEVLEKIKGFLLSNNQHYIVTLNPEMVVETQKHFLFKEIINDADLVIPDGIGILWAMEFIKKRQLFSIKKNKKLLTNFLRILLQSILAFIYSLVKLLFNSKHRINILQYRTTGIDLIYRICESENIKDKRIYLLGAEGEVANRAANNLKRKYSNIDIVGAEEGIRKSQDSNTENEELIQRINRVTPNIIFVAFGVPKQEIWISDNLKKMPSVKIAIGVGGSFDFIAGKIKRAPLFFQRLGLEWLYRLIKEPKRIKRIYNATVKFGLIILRSTKQSIISNKIIK